MPGTTRSFIALEIPPSLVDELARLRSRLDREIPGVRWADPATYHLTLAFLGDAPDALAGPIGCELALAVAEVGPIDVELSGLGAFPDPAHPRVLWAGVADSGLAALSRLREAAVRAATLAGHPPIDDRFHPHVTLGRFRRGRGKSPDVSAVLGPFAGWNGGRFEARDVALFASDLTPNGPRHSALSTAPLGGVKIRSST